MQSDSGRACGRQYDVVIVGAGVFMPLVGFPGYVEICEKVTANDYEGFELIHR